MEKGEYNKVQRFEDLVVWQKSMKLAKYIFLYFKKKRTFISVTRLTVLHYLFLLILLRVL